MDKINYEEILAKYLVDDGLDRDIISLANDMGFEVGVAYTKKEFLAIVKVAKSTGLIILNKSRVNDEGLLKFILAYQLAEFMKYSQTEEALYFQFMIEHIDVDTYKLAQAILERTDRYKDIHPRPKKKVFNKKNKKIAWRHDL